MASHIVRVSGLPVDVRRYATYSHPFTQDGTAKTEIACLECRADSLPVVIMTFEKASVFAMLYAISAHEKESHPAALRVAA